MKNLRSSWLCGIAMISIAAVVGCSDDDTCTDCDADAQVDGAVLDDATAGDSDGAAAGNDATVGDDATAETSDLTCNPDFKLADACGGDIVGTWHYRSACTSTYALPAVVVAVCGDIESSVIEAAVNGTLTITEEDYDLDVDTELTTTLTVPASCLKGAIINTCGKFQAAFVVAAATLPDDYGVSISNCTEDDAEGCICEVVATLSQSESGEFSINGGVATLDSNDYYFCVANDGVLRYSPSSTSDAVDKNVSYVLTR